MLSFDQDIFNKNSNIIGDKIHKIIKLYLDKTGDHLNTLKQVKQNLDANIAILPSHSIKGSSMQLGALQMAYLANRIEFLALNIVESNQGSATDLIPLIDKIIEEFNIIKSKLEII